MVESNSWDMLDSMQSQMNMVLSRMATMEDKMNSLIQDRALHEAMSNHVRMQESTILNQAKELEILRRENQKLQRMVDAAKYRSPAASSKSSPKLLPPSTSPESTLLSISKELETAATATNEVGTSELKTATTVTNDICTVNAAHMSSLPHPAAAPLLPITCSKPTVGGIHVKQELERLWNNNIIVNKVKGLKGNGVISRRMLFDSTSDLFVGCHPAFEHNERARYCKCMTLVAMAMGPDDWNLLTCGGEPSSHEIMTCFDRIEKKTMDLAFELEVQAGLRKVTKKCKAKAGIHSLGERFGNICNQFLNKLSMSQLELDNMIAKKVNEEGPRLGFRLELPEEERGNGRKRRRGGTF